MSKVDQLNAIARFSFYLLILLVLFSGNESWIYLPLTLLTLTVVLYKIDNKDENKKEDFKNTSKEKEKKVHFADEKEHFVAIDQEDIKNKQICQTQLGPKVLGPEKCTMPTKENPFMNFTLADHMEDPQRPPACDVEDPLVQEEMDRHFYDNLYLDVEDLWEKRNSQRQFFTMPVSNNPNNQREFAEWLYNDKICCKTDQERCLKYEDLRFKR